MSKESITKQYKTAHDALTYAFYVEKAMPKEEFDRQHGELWDAYEQELRAGGYLPAPEPDLKALYQDAETITDKIDILAKAVGLIENVD